jgi:hypothetical protein
MFGGRAVDRLAQLRRGHFAMNYQQAANAALNVPQLPLFDWAGRKLPQPSSGQVALCPQVLPFG